MTDINTANANKYQRGFTLIELLVVVSLLLFLLSIILPQFSDFQKRSRDTARIQTVKQLKNAMDTYWPNNFQYPTVSGSDYCVDLVGWEKLDGIMSGEIKDPLYPPNGNFRYCSPDDGRSYGILILLEEESRRRANPVDLSGETDVSGYCKTGIGVENYTEGDWADIPLCGF